MPWQNYRRYLHQALTLPPRVVARKARHKIARRVQRDIGRLRSQLLGTGLSDAQFQRALAPRFSSIQAFLDHTQTAREPRFFLCPGRRDATLAAIRALCPNAEAPTLAAAARARDHMFDLLGSGPVALGARIDWHADFKTGHRWPPRRYYADVRHAPYPGGADIKIPWELSRCQHFAWLGQAYWYSGDETYAQEFVAQVLDWIAQNPPRLGVNWTCAMDVAIRAVNWLWGYYFFEESPALTDAFHLAFFKSLLVHGRHIMQNLEWTETLTSNHYLSDIVGLVYLGVLLPEFKEAQRWREFGLRELEYELFKQVYPDGVDFEASTHYHRLVAELFVSATLLAQLNGHTFSPVYLERLERMLEFVLHAAKPDGTAPSIGDNDNGRLHRLKAWAEPEREWSDHRYLLAIGAVLFQRQDFARAAGDQWEEAAWMFGEQALSAWRDAAPAKGAPREPASRAFPNAGLYILRAQDGYMIVDAGPNGQNGNGGHAHNDLLSFELHASGQSWLIDPGTYVYTADFEARNLFRSTAFHNTIRVDGQEQNRFFDKTRLFQLQPDAHPTVHCWDSAEAYDFVDASHDGYIRLPQPVTHRRQVFFGKGERLFWVVRDILAGQGRHTFELFFQVGDAAMSRSDGPAIDLAGRATPGEHLLILPLEADGLVVATEPAWRSQGYGQKAKGLAITYSKAAAVPCEFVTVLWPWRGPESLDQAMAAAQAAAQPVVRRLSGIPAGSGPPFGSGVGAKL
jgi:hypothetical protein